MIKKILILKKGKHPITLEKLPLEVQWVVTRLNDRGFLAYLVGGSVRDILLNKKPKDFDIATDARPEEITRLFYNSRVIGKRFLIVHIFFRDGQILEISTFRKRPKTTVIKHSPKESDNFFGSPKEDAWRRDLTINGLFYDTATGDIIDYIGGLKDLRHKIIRTIGPPDQRFCEDPVRMIRAIRHAARHHFMMEAETWQAIQRHSHELKYCSSSRVLAEFTRELSSGHSFDSLRLMFESKLLVGWLPTLHHWLKGNPKFLPLLNNRFGPHLSHEWGGEKAFWQGLRTNDSMIQKNSSELSISVLLGAFLLPLGWSYIFSHYRKKRGTGRLWSESIKEALTPLLQELYISGFMQEKLTNLFHSYWRFHLVLHQPNIKRYLLRSEYMCEAFQLFCLNLTTHNISLPAELQELKDICEEAKIIYRYK